MGLRGERTVAARFLLRHSWRKKRWMELSCSINGVVKRMRALVRWIGYVMREQKETKNDIEMRAFRFDEVKRRKRWKNSSMTIRQGEEEPELNIACVVASKGVLLVAV